MKLFGVMDLETMGEGFRFSLGKRQIHAPRSCCRRENSRVRQHGFLW
jgi:hypothetical protein